MNSLKLLFKRISEMHQATYLLLKWSLILSCLFLAAAIAFHFAAYSSSTNVLDLIHISKELGAMPQSILLLASIGSVCMEDLSNR